MPTPEQEALNTRVSELPVIEELKSSDKEIINDLEGLRVGQEELRGFVSDGFNKGKVRMDGIEVEVREVKDDVKGLTQMIASFISQTQTNHNELKSEIQNGKIQELRDELKSKRNDEDKKASFKSGLLIGLSILGAGSILSILGYLFIKAYG